MTSSSTTPAIAARGVRKSFGDHRVLDDVDLTVTEGTIFSLLGPVGAEQREDRALGDREIHVVEHAVIAKRLADSAGGDRGRGRATRHLFLGLSAVSYTHLRAHETPEHLVCRLLLEKTKKK